MLVLVEHSLRPCSQAINNQTHNDGDLTSIKPVIIITSAPANIVFPISFVTTYPRFRVYLLSLRMESTDLHSACMYEVREIKIIIK